jgi:hypothetical protein
LEEDCFWRGTVFGGGLSWPWVCSLVLGLFFEEGYFLAECFGAVLPSSQCHALVGLSAKVPPAPPNLYGDYKYLCPQQFSNRPNRNRLLNLIAVALFGLFEAFLGLCIAYI